MSLGTAGRVARESGSSMQTQTSVFPQRRAVEQVDSRTNHPSLDRFFIHRESQPAEQGNLHFVHFSRVVDIVILPNAEVIIDQQAFPPVDAFQEFLDVEFYRFRQIFLFADFPKYLIGLLVPPHRVQHGRIIQLESVHLWIFLRESPQYPRCHLSIPKPHIGLRGQKQYIGRSPPTQHFGCLFQQLQGLVWPTLLKLPASFHDEFSIPFFRFTLLFRLCRRGIRISQLHGTGHIGFIGPPDAAT